MGWLVTTALLLRRARRQDKRQDREAHENPNEAQAYKTLLAACASGSPVHARAALIAWCDSAKPGQAITSLDHVRAMVDDAALHEQLQDLDGALYSGAGATFHGNALADIVKRLRKKLRDPGDADSETLSLYPTS